MGTPASFVTAATVDGNNTFVGDQTFTGDLTITGDAEDYKILRAPTPAGSNANESAHTHSGTGLT